MKENAFQKNLIKEIKEMFPGCLVLKNDEQYIQGIPDLTILYKAKWALLECKASADEPYRPNQEYYLDQANGLSFARTIYPQNKEEVLHELQQTFESRRKACILKRK